MKPSIPSRLHSGLWLAASALALAACTNVYYPPATGGAPVVDASVGSSTLSASNGTSPAQTAQTAAAPVATDGVLHGLHLQAGTFSSHDNAERMASNIRNKLPSVSTLVHVAPRGSNWRVLIGPFVSDAERAHAASTIRDAIGSDVVNAAP